MVIASKGFMHSTKSLQGITNQAEKIWIYVDDKIFRVTDQKAINLNISNEVIYNANSINEAIIKIYCTIWSRVNEEKFVK